MLFSIGCRATTLMKQPLISNFRQFDLSLAFRKINTTKKQRNIKLLDMLHHANENAAFGFNFRDHVEQATTHRNFVNGNYHHPVSVFKSIIYREAIWLRRLKKLYSDYHHSLERLKIKVLDSNFSPNITNGMITSTKKWKEGFHPHNRLMNMKNKASCLSDQFSSHLETKKTTKENVSLMP